MRANHKTSIFNEEENALIRLDEINEQILSANAELRAVEEHIAMRKEQINQYFSQAMSEVASQHATLMRKHEEIIIEASLLNKLFETLTEERIEFDRISKKTKHTLQNIAANLNERAMWLEERERKRPKTVHAKPAKTATQPTSTTTTTSTIPQAIVANRGSAAIEENSNSEDFDINKFLLTEEGAELLKSLSSETHIDQDTDQAITTDILASGHIPEQQTVNSSSIENDDFTNLGELPVDIINTYATTYAPVGFMGTRNPRNITNLEAKQFESVDSQDYNVTRPHVK